jgi:hypothetical protein
MPQQTIKAVHTPRKIGRHGDGLQVWVLRKRPTKLANGSAAGAKAVMNHPGKESAEDSVPSLVRVGHDARIGENRLEQKLSNDNPVERSNSLAGEGSQLDGKSANLDIPPNELRFLQLFLPLVQQLANIPVAEIEIG